MVMRGTKCLSCGIDTDVIDNALAQKKILTKDNKNATSTININESLDPKDGSKSSTFMAKWWSHVTSAGWRLIIENSKFWISRGKLDHSQYMVN